MTDDYTHSSPEEMERAMELVAKYKPRKFSNFGKISTNQKSAVEHASAVAS